MTGIQTPPIDARALAQAGVEALHNKIDLAGGEPRLQRGEGIASTLATDGPLRGSAS